MKVVRNKIKNIKGKFFILSEQEKNLTLSFSDVIKSSSENSLLKKNNGFVSKNYSKISFTSVSNYQLFSLVSSFIPFFEHNDANRTLMGIGMQKQAVMLLKRESAFVNSGIARRLIGNSSFVDFSYKSGLVTFISDKKIYLKSFLFLKKLNINNKVFSNKVFSGLKFKKLGSPFYALDDLKTFNYLASTQNAVILKPYLKKNNYRINRKEALRGDMTKNSTELGIGKNIFLGYMSWKGYNFEDAIVINEKLINNDSLTSMHIKKYVIFLLKDRLGSV